MPRLAIRGGPPVRDRPFPAWPVFDERERAGLVEVLESGRWWATEGSKVRAFEEAWGRFHGVGPAVAATNGTHALQLALEALGIGDGDEVIVPSYTFIATASAVVRCNAIPVFADIDPETLCIAPASIESVVTERTRAVIAVHLAGHPADLDRIQDLCRSRDLRLIEDCAHAHGSTWRDRPVATFGDAGAYSFQQSKLMTSGEGGAVVSRREDVLAAARSFGDCGRRPGRWFYDHFVLGDNARMTEAQAAILLAQLARFPEQNRIRNERARWLSTQLAEIPGVRPQARDARATSQGYYCYVVRVDPEVFGVPTDVLRRALEAEGIPMTTSYPPVHRLACFADPDGFAPRYRAQTRRSRFPDYGALSLPQTERAARETLWFRHPCLLGSPDDVADVVRAVEKIHASRDELREVTEA